MALSLETKKEAVLILGATYLGGIISIISSRYIASDKLIKFIFWIYLLVLFLMILTIYIYDKNKMPIDQQRSFERINTHTLIKQNNKILEELKKDQRELRKRLLRIESSLIFLKGKKKEEKQNESRRKRED